MQQICIKYLLWARYDAKVLGGTGVSKRYKNLCPQRACFLVRGRDNKQNVMLNCGVLEKMIAWKRGYRVSLGDRIYNVK